MIYQQWLSQAASLLTHSDSPKRDAEIILCFVTGKSRTFLVAFGETQLTANEFSRAEDLLQRRIKGEPIAYLVGMKEFWSLPLSVSPATLIPRPDTERLVELALAYLPENAVDILDLGTGTGAIALAIASERQDCFVVGVDFQPEAVELARNNAQRLNIKNVSFVQGSWFEPVIHRTFKLIVSNPPYIDIDDPHLEQGDVRFEPRTALVAQQEGLADIQFIIAHSRTHLQSGGCLMIEHGWQQAGQVRRIFDDYRFSSITTEKDYGGNDRITLGCFRG